MSFRVSSMQAADNNKWHSGLALRWGNQKSPLPQPNTTYISPPTRDEHMQLMQQPLSPTKYQVSQIQNHALVTQSTKNWVWRLQAWRQWSQLLFDNFIRWQQQCQSHMEIVLSQCLEIGHILKAKDRIWKKSKNPNLRAAAALDCTCVRLTRIATTLDWIAGIIYFCAYGIVTCL
jgi:hypothetical protein